MNQLVELVRNLVTVMTPWVWGGCSPDEPHASSAPRPHERGYESSPGFEVLPTMRPDWQLYWLSGTRGLAVVVAFEIAWIAIKIFIAIQTLTLSYLGHN